MNWIISQSDFTALQFLFSPPSPCFFLLPFSFLTQVHSQAGLKLPMFKYNLELLNF